MKVLDGPWRSWEAPANATSVTIGVLDGVHRGHRELISRLDSTKTRTVLTFDPHPVEVLRPGTPPRLITTIDERIVLLDEVGVDLVGVLDLTEIREQSPEEFIEHVLAGKLQVAHLVVGEDFRFGRDRAGDVALLRALAGEFGYEVDTVPLVGDQEGAMSSSRVRALIERGAVEEAALILGSLFSLTNTVVHGDKRGREIGYPTANIRPPDRKVVPARGVYACFVNIAGTVHDAAVNVGVRPTFGGGEVLIEAFILDFDADVYDQEMTVEFVEYLRPELRFDGVEELVERMGDDVDRARIILSETRGRI